MNRIPSAPEFHATDQVRFQLSLLHLLYTPTGSSPQVNELECLLRNPAGAMQFER